MILEAGRQDSSGQNRQSQLSPAAPRLEITPFCGWRSTDTADFERYHSKLLTCPNLNPTRWVDCWAGFDSCARLGRWEKTALGGPWTMSLSQ
jgi:hypothetical protein